MFAFVTVSHGKSPDTPAVSEAAKTRATLYQAEARKVFLGYHWVVGREQLGELVLVHAALLSGVRYSGEYMIGGANGSPVFYFTAKFHAVSGTETRCVISLVVYYVSEKKVSEKRHLLGPFPANGPEMTTHIKGLMAKAEEKLGRDHPEFRAP